MKSDPMDTVLTNSAGIDDLWSCPACYADHQGSFDGETIDCECGHRFKCTLDHLPVCRSELLEDEAELTPPPT